MALSDPLLIVGISLFTAFLGEGVTYFLVYRTEQYKRLKNEIEKQTKKCEWISIFTIKWVCQVTDQGFNWICNFILVEKKKETLGEALDKQQKKKLERDEEKLKNNNRDLSLVKMKSMWVNLINFQLPLSSQLL